MISDMNTDTGPQAGVEWVGGKGSVEMDGRGWPILHADDPCDGRNPRTGHPCLRMYHGGYHRDAVGTEWLDDE